VIYYTDGFTEAANPSGEAFDEDNLTNEFSWACETYSDPQKILDHLFSTVQTFIGADNSNADDMTLVVMRIQIPGEDLAKKSTVTVETTSVKALAETLVEIADETTTTPLDKPKRMIELPKL
jgi:hypothetical protein